MSRDEETLRMHLRAQTLSDAKDNAAAKGSPQRANTADDGRFKCEQQLRRPGIG